ncbi:MAG: prolyl oligopeptidase family serine peptidase, partial [Armatimonadia bacterium]
ITEVCKYFPVDPDRLYLSGVSMGGMGAWNLALRHPGMFAAVTPMCGQTDMFLWWGWPRQDVPVWKRWLIEWDNAADQTPNLRNQNIFVQHGELDTLIPAQQTRLMIEAGEKQGTPIKSYFFPGESHFIYFRDDAYDNAWGWQKQFKLDRSPRRVDLKAYSLEYNRAYWLTIDEFEHWFTPAEVTAELSADNKSLTIKSSNISRLTLNLSDLKSTDPQVTWNDQPVKGTIKDNLLTLSLPGAPVILRDSRGGPWSARAGLEGLRKTRGLCGPCEEVFDTRFLLVQGTGGTADQKTALATQVAQWAADWDAFADGLPPVKTDAEVTDQDLQSANLVLFGTPETNSLLAKIAPSLPIKIGDHRYELAGKVYEGSDLGLVMCYPNPLSPSHYVLIYSGEPYGGKLSINHKHDLLPDFVVFTTKSFGRDDTNDALCAGFFDMDWQPKPNLTWQTNQP